MLSRVGRPPWVPGGPRGRAPSRHPASRRRPGHRVGANADRGRPGGGRVTNTAFPGRAGRTGGQHHRHPGPGPIGHQGQVGLVLDLLAPGERQGRSRVTVEQEADRLGQQLGVRGVPPVDRDIDRGALDHPSEATDAPLLLGTGATSAMTIRRSSNSSCTSPVDGRPSGEPKPRWTTAVTPQPTARLARTDIGSPEPLTTAVSANSPMAASRQSCSQRLNRAGPRRPRDGGRHPDHREGEIGMGPGSGRRPPAVGAQHRRGQHADQPGRPSGHGDVPDGRQAS